ncbi:MAG: ribosome maturation factor RimM [Lachnospiraceae bacterium]
MSEYKDDLFKVGVITSTHGLKGEVKVYPTTDDPTRYELLDQILLDTGKELLPFKIEHVKYFKNLVILKFKDIDHINDIEKYLKKELYVTRDQAVPLKENEYFIADLIGLTAVAEDGEILGVIEDVLQSAANDVYVIKKEHAPDLLVPAIKECVRSVDLIQKTIQIRLLKGLR